MSDNINRWRSADMPPKGTESSGWEISRTKVGKKSVVAIISDRWYGVYTHHFARRTFPCLGPTCFCNETGKEARWYGFLLASEYKTHKRMIWEYTAGVAEIVAKALQDFNTLRGVVFEFWRKGERDNSPLGCRVIERMTDLSSLPKAVSIQPLLARIWEYKTDKDFKKAHATQENLELGLATEDDTRVDATDLDQAAFDMRGDLRADIRLVDDQSNKKTLQRENGRARRK